MTLFGKILLGVILITAAVLVIKGGSKNDPELVTPVENEEVSEPTPANDVAFKGSMKDLIARGGEYKCSFTHSTDAGDSSGTVYISGMKMRGDFVSVITAGEASMESHMISDGEFTYVWSPAMPMGMKMKITEEMTPSGTTVQAVPVDQELDYSCEKWNVVESQFSLPAGVNFTELKAAA